MTNQVNDAINKGVQFAAGSFESSMKPLVALFKVLGLHIPNGQSNLNRYGYSVQLFSFSLETVSSVSSLYFIKFWKVLFLRKVWL